MEFTRINSLGMKFTFTEKLTGTLVTCDGKSIFLDMNIDKVNRCYYQWQMRGLKIQEAFPDLPADQREFLMTGITPDEWNDIFKDEEE